MNQPTIRKQLLSALCDPTEWDADVLGLPEQEAHRLLDAYRAEVLAKFSQGEARDLIARHRNHVLTEAAELVLTQRATVYNDAGQKTAEGLDRARDILLNARTDPHDNSAS